MLNWVLDSLLGIRQQKRQERVCAAVSVIGLSFCFWHAFSPGKAFPPQKGSSWMGSRLQRGSRKTSQWKEWRETLFDSNLFQCQSLLLEENSLEKRGPLLRLVVLLLAVCCVCSSFLCLLLCNFFFVYSILSLFERPVLESCSLGFFFFPVCWPRRLFLASSQPAFLPLPVVWSACLSW